MRACAGVLVVALLAVPEWAAAAPPARNAPPPALATGASCKLTAALVLAETAGGAPGKKRLKAGVTVVVGTLDKAWAQVEGEGVSGWVKQALLQRRCKREPATTPAASVAPATPAPEATGGAPAASATPAPPAPEPTGAAPAPSAAEATSPEQPAAPSTAAASAPEPPPGDTASARSPDTLVPPTPGRLLVKVREPGASVLIDGQLVGQSPLAALALEAGPHVVTVEKVGFARAQKDVDVAAGVDVVADVTLLPAGGSVTTAPGSALLRFVGYGVAAAGVVGVGASAALLARDAKDESRATQLGWGGMALGIAGAALVGLGSDIFGTGSVVVVPAGAALAVAATF